MEEIIIDGLDEIEMQNTAVDDIDSENVNLIFIGIDKSGSMSPYRGDMVSCLKEFKQALTDSKEADEILVARADFNSSINVGGLMWLCRYFMTEQVLSAVSTVRSRFRFRLL